MNTLIFAPLPDNPERARLWFDEDAGMLMFSGDMDVACEALFAHLRDYVDKYMRTALTPKHCARYGIGDTAPAEPIVIRIGDTTRYTDKNIRKWATGNLADIDFAIGEESLLIEYLSMIIVDKVLNGETQ